MTEPSGLIEEQRLALEPLRRALLDGALAEADRVRDATEEAGRADVAAARDDVAAMLARARAQGVDDGVALRRADESRARSIARTDHLTAQRATYEQLRRTAREAVRELLHEPANRELLAQALRRGLGGRAVVTDTEDGGVFALAADGRSIDASVAALVDGALAGLDLEQLWTAG